MRATWRRGSTTCYCLTAALRQWSTWPTRTASGPRSATRVERATGAADPEVRVATPAEDLAVKEDTLAAVPEVKEDTLVEVWEDKEVTLPVDREDIPVEVSAVKAVGPEATADRISTVDIRDSKDL